MTLAEQFEAAAKELRDSLGFSRHIQRQGLPCDVGVSQIKVAHYADLLDRAAELARDNERVVQSIVARNVP